MMKLWAEYRKNCYRRHSVEVHGHVSPEGTVADVAWLQRKLWDIGEAFKTTFPNDARDFCASSIGQPTPHLFGPDHAFVEEGISMIHAFQLGRGKPWDKKTERIGKDEETRVLRFFAEQNVPVLERLT